MIIRIIKCYNLPVPDTRIAQQLTAVDVGIQSLYLWSVLKIHHRFSNTFSNNFIRGRAGFTLCFTGENLGIEALADRSSEADQDLDQECSSLFLPPHWARARYCRPPRLSAWLPFPEGGELGHVAERSCRSGNRGREEVAGAHHPLLPPAPPTFADRNV